MLSKYLKSQFISHILVDALHLDTFFWVGGIKCLEEQETKSGIEKYRAVVMATWKLIWNKQLLKE